MADTPLKRVGEGEPFKRLQGSLMRRAKEKDPVALATEIARSLKKRRPF